VPPIRASPDPTLTDLRKLWARYESRRHHRDRDREWRRVQEQVRRDPLGDLTRSPNVDSLPAYLRDAAALGPHARAALRPQPRQGRVLAAGIDTWSPCWYAPPRSPLSRAMKALAIQPSGRAWLLPDRLAGYRLGWFPDPQLVFAEGHPAGEGLARASDLAHAMTHLRVAAQELGIPLHALPDAGLRRLDVAVDLWTDSSAEGLAFLECVATASLATGKLCAYRAERCVQSVLLKTRGGRTQARFYDKGEQCGQVARGRWIRLEAQWRFSRDTRPAIVQLDADTLRSRFARRFDPFWQAAGGLRHGGVAVVSEQLAGAVTSGQLAPSRARSVAGYLILRAAGVPQGARRTAYELERECRQLGLSLSLLQATERRVDVATVLEECTDPAVWR